MVHRRASIALVVTIILTTVLTVFLGALGLWNYTEERQQHFTDVREQLDLTADQLASGLAYPLWNYDYVQVDRILEGAMKDRNIHGIVVVPADPTHSSPVRQRAVIRNGQGGVLHSESTIVEEGLLVAIREITFAGKNIGVVRVSGTTRFAEEELRDRTILMLLSIAVLDVVLICSLYWLLWKIVLRPLRGVEEYATAVRSGMQVHSRIPATNFHGELKSLSDSIESMVTLLQSRYRELQASQSALRLTQFAVSHLSDAMFLIRPDGSFADVNDAACRSLGYSREELLALNVHAIDPCYPREKWNERWQVLKRRGSVVVESRHRTKDGREFPVEVSANFFAFEDQEYNFSFSRDITARRKDEEEKARLEAALQQAQKMESIGRIAGGIAHDFNNMLTGILGSAELLDVRFGHTHPKIREYTSLIINTSNRAADLTRKLTAFSRKGVLKQERVDLCELVTRVVDILQHSIDPRVHLERDLPGHPCYMQGDPAMVQNAILNLALNARDAMSQGGVLRFVLVPVTLNDAECRNPQFSIEPGPFWRLSVIDTGAGITPEVMARIFEPFFTTKDVGRGTGLGLSAVYGTMITHQGAVLVESTLGQGSAFHLLLPRHEPKVAEPGTIPPTQLPPGQGRILLIDDSPDIRVIGSEILSELGYQVQTAEDGKRGTDIFLQQPGGFDLVILDMMMPGMNGREVFDRIRQANTTVPVLIMSGYSSESAGTDALLQQKDCHFLGKPYSRIEFAQAIHKALARTRTPTE